jgi:uncharacterized protein YecT (DUF1311 family)
MRIRNSASLAVAATLSVLVLGASVVVLAASAAARTHSGHAAAISAPVIHESFTPLTCSGSPQHRSTLQSEGCAEQQILRTDKKVDALNRTIFTKLADNAARRRFIAGHNAWLSYRRAFCLSRSDIFEGGTDAALVDATCVAGVNAEHVKDLKTFASDLSSG